MSTDAMAPTEPATTPVATGLTAPPTRAAIGRRVRAVVNEFAPEGDNPLPGTGRISVTIGAAVIALCLAVPACLEIWTLVRNRALFVTLETPASTTVPAGYEGVVVPAGGYETQFVYAGAPAWALVACGLFAAMYVALLVCCVICTGRVCLATVPPGDTNGSDPGDPWNRVVRETRRLGRSIVAAAGACGCYAWAIPSIIVASPDTEEVPHLVTAGHFSILAWFAALVAANFMAFLAHALSRLHERTASLAAENTELLEQTEGLV